MSELLKLAERMEALEGPDRETDAEIAIACGVVREREGDMFYGHRDYSVMVLERGYYDHEGNAPELPAYTASLDAARTLVPEGWWLAGLNYCPVDFRSSQDREWHAEFAGPITWAVVDREVGEEPQFECEGGNADTPALALCAAALRARATGQ